MILAAKNQAMLNFGVSQLPKGPVKLNFYTIMPSMLYNLFSFQ
jgi:hypothetical protein